MKTHKPIALRFWVESDVNPLCLSSRLIGVDSSREPFSKDPTMVSESKVCLGDELRQVLESKVFLSKRQTSPVM